MLILPKYSNFSMNVVDFPIVLMVLFFRLLLAEEIRINDEIQPGNLITDLSSNSAFIHDKPEGKVEYRLLTGASFIEYLHVDVNTGKLFAKKTIDRDSLCMEIELCCQNDRPCSITISVAIVAVNSLKTNEPQVRSLTIIIDDKNDHKPTFDPATFNLSISESCAVSTKFHLPLAVDKDSDIYSVKSYKFISKNDDPIFSLETECVDKKLTAYLRLKSHLDREDFDQYSLSIAAIDGGVPPLTGTLVIVITVTDINDNPPIFEKIRYSVSVKESQMSSDPIIQMLATDKDTGDNAEIFYKMDWEISSAGSKDMFRIDLRSGAINMIAPLDYEKQQSYKLIITASNRQPGVNTATATLTISVLNINDEKPVIFVNYLNNRQHAQIIENTAAQKFVAVITVSDKDIGVAGKVSCRLENHQELFDLRPSIQDQYKLHTRQQLDRETTSRYSLVVICQDQGSPSLSADVIVSVIIKDENDNKPEINSQPVYHISENKPAGTIITKIEAVDKDEGVNGKLIYTISDPHSMMASFLSIDAHTGVLKTIQLIDREATNPPLNKFDIVVTVSDSGTPKQSSMKTLQIIIDDENDNAPQFVQTILRFSVTENETPIYRLGQIEVSDPDEIGTIRLVLSYSKLNYRKCPFSLTADKNRYWLMTTESLDWEVQPLHELIVTATDGAGYKSHTTSATIIVTVLDVNDNVPIFIFPKPGNRTTHAVSYRQQPGHVLLTVSATDKDNPAVGNGRYYFSINGDTGQLFNIDPNLGKIRIHKQMTTSDIGDHLVIIRVEDHGTPPLSSELRIKVRIMDSPVHFNEKGQEFEGPKIDSADFSGSIFSDKESIFVFGLVLILLIVMILICFVIYVRHMKGWLVFLPDLISMCRLKEHSNSTTREKYNTYEDNVPNSTAKYCTNSNYYNQRYMTSPQPNFPRSPEIFIKNGRDCYEVLKGPHEMQSETCQIPIIHDQQYNDLVSTTILPPFQDSYLTLHQYPNDYPMLKDNINIQNFSKSLKPISTQSVTSVIPLSGQEKGHPPSFVSSKASYAVSFPTEQSTFV